VRSLSSNGSGIGPQTPSPAGALSRRTLLQGGAALGAGAALGLPLPSLGQGPASGPELGLELERFLESWVGSRRVANMVAALGRGQAEPQFVARGRDSFTSARPADRDSLYRIYSMTKPITGMAAMMLVDEGLITLDQPIAEILPAFAKM